ncbi:MAG: AAA family ATPase [Roseibium sp.]|nr:AAA family ATPase [Roseibium sp.]
MNTPAKQGSAGTAERAILGAILNHPPSYFDVSDVLRADHFERPINQRIYATVGDLMATKNRAGLQMLVSRLGEEYSENGQDGLLTLNYLTALLRDLDKTDGVSPFDYVDDVVNAWRVRQMQAAGAWLNKQLGKPGQEPSVILSNLQERIEAIKINSETEPLLTLGQSAAMVLEESMDAQSSGQVPGFDTGLPTLDEIMGRLLPGDLGAIGAPQGSGKTVVGVQLARRCQFYRPSILFQLEMHHKRISRRALAGESNISSREILNGTYELFALDELKAAKARLDEERLFLDARPKLPLEEIRARCVHLKHKYNLGSVVIDHLRLIQSHRPFKNKWDRMEWVTSELKAMAKELDILVVVLSQVTQQSQRRDDPSFFLSDLDGGGALVQDADWVIGLVRRDKFLQDRRPHFADPDEEEASKEFQKWLKNYRAAKGKVEITVMKNRDGSPGDMREFLFNGPAFRVSEIDQLPL